MTTAWFGGISNLIGVACVWVAATGAMPQSRADVVVLSDKFEGAVPVAEIHAIKSATTWHAFAGGGGLPSVQSLKTGTWSGSVLQFAGSNQKALVIGGFAPVKLAKPGDFIALKLSWRYIGGPTNPVQGFVMGLYDAGGAPVTAGNLYNDFRSGAHYAGYRVGKAPHAATEDLVVAAVKGIGTDFPASGLGTGDSGVAIAAPDMHDLSLKITLGKDGGLSFTCGVDGFETTSSTKDAASVPTTSFDTVLINPLGRGFGVSDGNNYVQVSDVEVTTNVR